MPRRRGRDTAAGQRGHGDRIGQASSARWTRRPLIGAGMDPQVIRRGRPPAHGLATGSALGLLTSCSSVPRARVLAGTLQPSLARLDRADRSGSWPGLLGVRRQQPVRRRAETTAFSATAKLTGSITTPSAEANPTRPTPPGSSRPRPSAGLSVCRAPRSAGPAPEDFRPGSCSASWPSAGPDHPVALTSPPPSVPCLSSASLFGSGHRCGRGSRSAGFRCGDEGPCARKITN